MLGLGVGFYKLGGEQGGSPWSPKKETSLEAWWRYGVGITTRTSGEVEYVTAWADQSGNGHDMLQTDPGEQPVYQTGGDILFDPTSDTQNLALVDGAGAGYDPASITLGGEFVVGIRMNPSGASTVIMGSNHVSKANEMVKLNSGSVMRLKNDGSGGHHDFTLDSGNTTDDSYWVISRDESDNITVYKDGSSSPFVANGLSRDGTFVIDAIGVRNNNPAGGAGTNNFDGTIKEIVIFKGTTSAALIANVNNRLSTL